MKLGTIGGLVVGATLVLLPTQAHAQIQRSFLNPSFEQPAFSPSSNCYIQVDESFINGWNTTHTPFPIAGSCNQTGYTGGKIIEIWTTTFQGVSTANTPTSAGNQFAELNAEQASQLYQNLCLYNGETIKFSLLHRGRASTTNPDVADFLIGLTTDTAPSPTYFGRFSTTSNGTVTTQPVASNGATIPPVSSNNAGNGWVRYNGTVPYTGATGNRPVGFAAFSTGNGNNTFGNFLDDVQFSGNPVVELAASSGGGAETETNPTTNPPKIRIVGLVPAGGISIPITVGGTAVRGTDYNTPSGTSTFNMTIPAGNYDGKDAASIFTVPFTVISNNISQGSRTITFTIQPSPSFFSSSTTTCGGAPIITSTYTIYDDDIGGTIFNDIDGSKIQNGAEAGTNAGGLNAVLVNSSNQVVATTPVAANGTYLFSNASAGTYTVEITTATATVGAAPPAVTLPSGWVSTGENLSGTPDGTVDGKLSITVGNGTVTGVNFGIRVPSPNLLLVKRITALNGAVINQYVDDTTSPQQANDNAANWPTPIDGTSGISTYLKGVINGGATKPGDLVEYTIYFLSNGQKAATNINLCDLVPGNSTFLPNSFSSTPESGINLTIGSTSTNLTNVPDADGGQFFNPGGTPSVSCSAANTNGAVVVNVVKSPANLPNATAPGTPTNSYGFIRFRAKIN